MKPKKLYYFVIVLLGIAGGVMLFFADRLIRDSFSLSEKSLHYALQNQAYDIENILQSSRVYNYLLESDGQNQYIEKRLASYFESLINNFDLKAIGLLKVDNGRLKVRLASGDYEVFLELPELAQRTISSGKVEVNIKKALSMQFVTAFSDESNKSQEYILAIHTDPKALSIPEESLQKIFIFIKLLALLLLISVVALLVLQTINFKGLLYAESICILVLGTTFAFGVKRYNDLREYQNYRSGYEKILESKIQVLRGITQTVRNDLRSTDALFYSNDDVSENEFDRFANSFLRYNSVYHAFMVLDAFWDGNELADFKILHLVAKGCEGLSPEVDFGNRLERDTAIKQLLSSAAKDGLLHSIRKDDIEICTSLGTTFVVVQPMAKLESLKSNPRRLFVLALLSPQEFMNKVMLKKDLFFSQLEAYLLMAPDRKKTDSLIAIASYPVKKMEEVNYFSVDYSNQKGVIRSKIPLLISGRSIYFQLIDRESETHIRLWSKTDFIFSLIVIVVVLVAVLNYVIRKGWFQLEKKVNHRTHKLRQRVRELNFLHELSMQLTSNASLVDTFSWFCQRCNTDEDFRINGLIRITLNGEPLCSDRHEIPQSYGVILNLPFGPQDEYNLEFLQFIDQRGAAEQDVPEPFLKQVQFIFNSWLDYLSLSQQKSHFEERFRHLAELSFDGISILRDYKYVWVNQAYANIIGYPLETILSPDFDFNKLLTEDGVKIANQRIEMRKRGEAPPPRFDLQLITASGKVIDVEISVVQLESNGHIEIFSTMRDVTEQRMMQRAIQQSEERLQQQNEELQLMNEELTASNANIRKLNMALSEAFRRAEAGDKLKTAFLNNISHEVRTPLNGICGASEILANPDLDISEKSEMIEILNISTRRLLRTITQYMDISLLESGNMPVIESDVSMSALMRPIIEEFDSQCKRKGIALKYNNRAGDFYLTADKSLLEKAVSHLIDNAVKFTQKGSIEVSTEISNANFKIEVRDTGVGMEKHFHSRVFDLFMQEDASDRRRYDGSGLGLPIVKRIMKLLNGNVSFESERGRGSTFRISFPVHQPVAELKKPESSEMQLPVPPHILIAEDEDSNYYVLKLLMEKRLNARTSRAENGEKAVEMVRNVNDFQLVLMDIKMPIMDGYQATKIIKALRPGLPVIAITAYGLSGDEQKALDAGCDDYIAKPVQASVMFQKIARLTGIQ